MRLPLTLLLLVIAHHSAVAVDPAKRHYSTHDYYVLEHDPRAGGSLDDIIRVLGVELVEQAGELCDHWLVMTERSQAPLRARNAASDSDPVLAALERLRARADGAGESLFARHSIKRQHARRLASSIRYLSRQTPRQRVKRAPPPIPVPEEPVDANNTARNIALRMNILDPLFTQQWHIVNDDSPHHMMNVTPVWDMGITGKGVISALVDDGLDYRSGDLAANFVSWRCSLIFVSLNSSHS
jgi:kexin